MVNESGRRVFPLEEAAMTTRWKLGLVMWGAGVIGVVALGVLVLPGLIARLPEVHRRCGLPAPTSGVLTLPLSR